MAKAGIKSLKSNLFYLLLAIAWCATQPVAAQICGTSGIDGPSSAVNPVNTYYPVAGNATLTTGQNSINLSAVPATDAYGNNYGNVALRAGDLILIIQMQDAIINTSNGPLYGANLLNSALDLLGGTGYTDLGNSGKYEYVIATNDVPLTGGVLKFRGANANGGIVNTYVNANATATRGQRRFQIVRVPQFSTLTLNEDITTVPYNGYAGGVVAFDVAGVMNFNGYKIDASERGFRGGYGPNGSTGNNVANVYAIMSTDTRSVGKGESVAGTPRYMYDGYKDVDNIIEGLPGGSFGKGAPANGGGGGNDHNAGGGGGGNGGSGGVGGLGWAGGGTLTSVVNNILNYPNGGRPGSEINSNPSILILGGGGGGGDANNATSGVKGGVGGGIVIVNVEAISGNGLIRANGGSGQAGVYGNAPDGAGGGGAGGSVFLRALKNSSGAVITIEARGGNGGNTEKDRNDDHGPGGGGGGGVVRYSVPGATIQPNVSKGNSGKTNSGLDNSHGAGDGANGISAAFTNADLPNYLKGGGSICYPSLTTTVTESNPGIAGSRNAGSTATYIIRVANGAGGGNAGDVKTQFTLPNGFIMTSSTASTTGNTAGSVNPTVNQVGNVITLGSYNISPGDQVVFTVTVSISNTVQPGIYHVSAQSDYLDPTRTSSNPYRRITARNNAFAGSNSTYETGAMGVVVGDNYDGISSASEDVYINDKPNAQDLTIGTIECETSISGTITANDPDLNHPPNTLSFSLEGSYDTAKGIFTINSSGNYLFTPSVRLFGTIEISYRVTDPLGLFDIKKITINQPKDLLNISETITNVSCFDGSNAAIHAIGSGGVGTLSYLWEYPNGSTATTASITQLKAGTYKLTVIDANSCSYSETYTVTQPNPLALSATHTVITCEDGTATVKLTASGGTSPYTYQFNGQSNQTGIFLNVPAGNFGYSVQDVNSCSVTTNSLTIFKPSINLTSSTAAVTACINNPIPTISFSVSDSQNPVEVFGLPAGVTASITTTSATISGTPQVSGQYSYKLKITGCNTPLVTGVITVTPDATLLLTAGNPTQTLCINNPISPIAYNFGGSGTGVEISGLPTGVTATVQGSQVSISGTPTQAGSFPFAIQTMGTCNNPIMRGLLTVVAEPSIASAGDDQKKCFTNTITLNANSPLVGVGRWSKLGSFVGTITNANTNTTTVTGLSPGTYSFIWTVTNGICNPNSDIVEVTIFNSLSNNNITADQTIFANELAQTLRGSLVTGGDGNHSYEWESTTNLADGFRSIVGATQPDLSIGQLYETTYFRRIVKSACGDLMSNVVRITVVPAADIVAVKSTTATMYVPGETVSYTIRVRNNGPSDARNVTVTDLAPAGTTMTAWSARAVSGTISFPQSSGTGNLNQTIPTLSNGAVAEYQITLNMPSNFTGSLVNTVSTTSTTLDPDPSCTGCTTPPIFENPKADIVSAKSTTATVYVPGETVSYTIRVRNNGPSDAKNVTVTDLAPVGTTISSWSARAVSGTINFPQSSGTGNLNQTIPTLSNGAVAEYQVTLNIPSNFTGSLVNTVSTTSTTSDPNPSCTGCTTPPVFENPKADIVSAKSTTATVYVPGETVSYTIRVRNNGPSDARNVTVTDLAPAGTTISSWSARAVSGTISFPQSSGTGNLNQTIPTLANGEVAEYQVTLNIPSNFTGSLVNTVGTTSTTSDPDPSCTGCTTSPIFENPKADIVAAKSTTATVYVPGETVSYTIRVRNNGPSDARNVTVTDLAPAGTTMTAWSARSVSGTINFPQSSGTGNLNQTIPTLANGAVAEYQVTLNIPSNFTGSLVNSVSTTGTTLDPDPNCTGCTTPPIFENPKADIVSAKSTTATVYVPGQTVSYTIRVRNNGPSDAKNVTVTDLAPGGTTISSWFARAVSGTISFPQSSGTGNLNQTIPTLANGAVAEYQVTLNIPSNFTGSLVNSVSTTGTTLDPDPNCTGCTTPPIFENPKADIVSAKSTTATVYVPGETVSYTIRVRNNGPSDAKNVTVTDLAPAGTTISSWFARAVSGTISFPQSSGTGNLNQTIPTLANGAVAEYQVTLNIPSNFTGSLVNTVSTTSTTTDPDPSCTGCTTPPIFENPKADIVSAKSTTATVYVPGETVSYTIRVRNNGPSDARNVTVTDLAPVGTTISSWSARTVSGTINFPQSSGTGNLNQTIPTLSNGAVAEYQVTLNIPSNFTGSLVNTVSTTSTTTDPDPSCTGCTTPPIFENPKADIVAAKSTTATVYVPGETVSYTIRVRNNGPSDARNVTVTDLAPAGTTISSWFARAVSGTINFPQSSGTGNLNQTIPTLANGAVAEYQVTLNIPSNFTGSLVNTVSTTSTTTDPDPSCTGCTTPPIFENPKADIVAAKSTTATVYVPGETVSYTIRVRNNGPSDARNVTVTDLAPAGTTISSWSARSVSGTINFPQSSGTGNLNQTIPTLANGAVAEYQVTLNIPSNFTGSLVNTVSTTSTTTDPDLSCTSCTTPPIFENPITDLVVRKQTDQQFYQPGGLIKYTISIKNNGPSDAKNVKVTDIAPAGTSIELWEATSISGTVNFNSLKGVGNLQETVALIANGAEAMFTIYVRVPKNHTGFISNQVSIENPATDPKPICDQCITPPIPTEPEADLVVTKTLKNPLQTTYTPGEDVSYLITIKNNGPGDARNVRVRDQNPRATEVFSWTAYATSGAVSLTANNGRGPLDQTIALLPNGATVIYEVLLRTSHTQTSTIVNIANVISETKDPVPDPNENPECPGCVPSPPLIPLIQIDLSILKTAENKELTLGSTFDYRLMVKNNSVFEANNVVVTDALPKEIDFTPLEDSPLEFEKHTKTLIWRIGKLGANQSVSISFEAKVNSLGKIVNMAKVTGLEPDPVLSNNSSTAVKQAVVLNVPNVVTPNGDGKNDTFRIEGIGLFKNSSLSIFNRWGNEVYRSNGPYLNNWDGSGLNEGTYFYLLKLDANDGQTKNQTGYITLIRD